MAYCSNCGSRLADGVKFCSECGAKVDATSSATNERRRIVYDGEIHKCPNCGDIIDAFELKCESCGYELRGSKGSSSARELMTKLEEIERTRPIQTRNFADVVTSYHKISETDNRKISTIRNFAIPNTKEDLLEFLFLAYSNIDIYRYDNYSSLSASDRALSDAWHAKFLHAYEKAQLCLTEMPEFRRIQEIYERNCRRIDGVKESSQRRTSKENRNILILSFVLLTLLLCFLLLESLIFRDLFSFIDIISTPFDFVNEFFANISSK